MSKVVQFRRGTTAQIASVLGAVGELFVDTSQVTVVVMDGVTTGGTTLATQAYARTTATTTSVGVVRPDGVSIAISSGVISLTNNFTTGLTVYGGYVGSSVSQQVEIAKYINWVGNTSTVRLFGIRNAATSYDYSTASFHLGHAVDGTDQASIEFNPNGFLNGFAVNTGVNRANRAITIDNGGRVLKPLTPAFLASNNVGWQTSVANTVLAFNLLNNTFAGSVRSVNYNNGTYAFTAPVPGLYEFYVQTYVPVNNINHQLVWRKNGAEASYNDTAIAANQGFNATGNIIINGRVTFELAIGDYVQVAVRSGAAGYYWYGGHSFFSGNLIG